MKMKLILVPMFIVGIGMMLFSACGFMHITTAESMQKASDAPSHSVRPVEDIGPRTLVMLWPKGAPANFSAQPLMLAQYDPRPWPSDNAIQTILENAIPYRAIMNKEISAPAVTAVTAANMFVHNQCKLDTAGKLLEIGKYVTPTGTYMLASYSGPGDNELVAKGYCPSSVDAFVPASWFPSN